MKKVYEVELRRTSYVVVTVEADSKEAAEAAAWQHNLIDNGHADWEVESIEEVTGEAK